jgi:hypothetical protein
MCRVKPRSQRIKRMTKIVQSIVVILRFEWTPCEIYGWGTGRSEGKLRLRAAKLS